MSPPKRTSSLAAHGCTWPLRSAVASLYNVPCFGFYFEEILVPIEFARQQLLDIQFNSFVTFLVPRQSYTRTGTIAKSQLDTPREQPQHILLNLFKGHIVGVRFIMLNNTSRTFKKLSAHLKHTLKTTFQCNTILMKYYRPLSVKQILHRLIIVAPK